MHKRSSRRVANEANDRHCRLLRPRRERPHRRATEQCDELTPPHAEHHVAPTAGWPTRCAAVGATVASSELGAIFGRRTVNTEPLPGSLATVTSPPIMRASLRERARPRPVPP